MNIETVAENNEILSSVAKRNISTNLQQQNLELKHTTESVNSNDMNSIIVDKDNEVSSSTSKTIKQSILQKSDTLLWLNGSDSNSATKDEPKYTAEIVNDSNINFKTGNIRSFDSTAENSTTIPFHLIYTTFGLTGLNKSDSVDVKLNYTTENHNSNTNNYRTNETEYSTPYFVPVTYENLISSNKNYNKSTTTTNSNLIKPNTSTIVTKQNKSDLDTKQNNFTFVNTTNNIKIIEISTTYERKTPEDTKLRHFKTNAEKEFLKSETYKTVKPLSRNINNHTQHRKLEPDIQNSLVTYAITQQNIPKVHEGSYQTHRKSYRANHSSNRYTAKAESKSRQNLGSNNNSSINNSIISIFLSEDRTGPRARKVFEFFGRYVQPQAETSPDFSVTVAPPVTHLSTHKTEALTSPVKLSAVRQEMDETSDDSCS
ncbi:probable serine/threonine-protein kinase clkA [Homalodisca vitripennis]|uniref:probable serine/threonine-protein kinase clkA n=1 Tax=Homalodisca vitripennis TaxID=197043 RepID=UPI001EEA3C4F|nr:probable serine/threonine-protein kinase clkA [Homalodisca vitripennis]